MPDRDRIFTFCRACGIGEAGQFPQCRLCGSGEIRHQNVKWLHKALDWQKFMYGEPQDPEPAA